MRTKNRANPTKTIHRHILLITSVINLFFINQSSFSENWSQFRGLYRNAWSSENKLLRTWPEEGPPLRWTARGLGLGYSSAIIVDGTVYVSGLRSETEEGYVTALDQSGEIQWATPYGKEWTGTHPGTRYPPTIDGGQLFLLSGHGVLYTLNAKTGARGWHRDVATDFGGTAPVMGFAESLLVDGDLVYCTPGGPDASIVALDRKTGKTRWTSVGHSDQSAYCAPQLITRGDTRLLVTLTNATLIALDPATGTIIWKVPFDEAEEMQNHSIAPIYHEGLLYATSGHRKGGILYGLSADGRDIEPRWSDAILSPNHGGLVCDGNSLYGENSKGRWSCLSLTDGSLQWQERGVGKGSVIYADERLYCYGEKGSLELIEATASGYVAHGTMKIESGDGPHWAHPSIADRTLYLRHGDVIVAYDISAP